MIVVTHVAKDKTRVKVFKYNERNRMRKVILFLELLKSKGKEYQIYKRDRGLNDKIYDIAIHYK